VLVTLPPELTSSQRTNLVRTFSRDLAEKYRSAVDFTVHEPRPGGDERHHHAHVLMTTREVTPTGLGGRTTLDLSGTERRARGLGPSKTELLLIRERWAQLTNEALSEAGLEDRVDHRSYIAQGVDRDPAVAMPQKVYYAERKAGTSTAAGDEIRARHRERAAARLRGTEDLARVLSKQKEEARQRAVLAFEEMERLPKKVRHAALTRDERNELRRQKYQANKEVINQKRRQSNQQVIQIEGGPQSRAEIRNQKRREQYGALSQEERELWRERARQNYRERAAAKSAQTPDATQKLQPSASATAEESVQNWRAYRANQNHERDPTPEDSVKNWLAYRNNQQVRNAVAVGESNDRVRDHSELSDPGDDNSSKRERDHDSSL
jgi:hypothetical protein